MSSAVLRLENLSVSLPRGRKNVVILDELNLEVARSKMLALVGESGSGKTITALSVMRLLPRGAEISGHVWLEDEDLCLRDEAGMRRLRGRDVGMVFQNPLAALNPASTVGRQIAEAFRVHNGGTARAARARARDLLGEVGIPDPAGRLDDYPHQFSGGMRQRVLLAMALACSPKLLIADEPTSGLDPLMARQIMALIQRLRREHDMGVLFVTHDLSVVEEHADAVHVLYAGRSAEWGPAARFFAHPRHPYSAALLGSVARVGQARLQAIPGNLPEPENRPAGCRFAPRCGYRQPACEVSAPPPDENGGTAAACLFPLPRNMQTDIFASPDFAPLENGPPAARKPRLEVRNLVVDYPGAAGWFGRGKGMRALDGVTLTLGQGECLGVVGESGSGKSTLGRAVLQMIGYEGSIALGAEDFSELRRAAPERWRAQRRRIQAVFQDPRESLNPRMRIRQIIAEPIRLAGKAAAPEQIAYLLGRVGLNPEIGESLPGDVSGGQAQRIAIARALAAEPELLVLDEPTSALDVSTQAMLLNLLKDLARESGLSYLLISHDLAVVSAMAERIAVLHAGRVVEMNATGAILGAPRNDYTRALVAAAPHLRGKAGFRTACG